MLEVRLQESTIAKVCHLGVRIVLDLLINVDIVLAKAIKKSATEVGCVGDVSNFFHVGWHRKVDQVFDPREANVLKGLR